MTRVFSKREERRWLKVVDRRMSSAGVVIEDHDGRLLVVKAHYKHYWSLPGGMVDAGESPLRAALREVKEEVGFDLDVQYLQFSSVAYRHGEKFDSYQFTFRYTSPVDSTTEFLLQKNEIEAFAWVTKEQVIRAEEAYGQGIDRWAQDEAAPYVEQTFPKQF